MSANNITIPEIKSSTEFVEISLKLLSQLSNNSERDDAIVELVNEAAKTININVGEIDEIHDYRCERCYIKTKKYNEGYSKGYDIGFEEGKDEGYDEGFGDGKEEALSTKYLDKTKLLQLLNNIGTVFNEIPDERVKELNDRQLKTVHTYLIEQTDRFKEAQYRMI